MKALVKTKAGPDGMRCMEIPEPIPGGDDLKVKVFACGICGTDIHLLHDSYPCRLPVVRGLEFSGVVTEVGENVSQFRLLARSANDAARVFACSAKSERASAVAAQGYPRISSFASERSSWQIVLRLLSNHMVDLKPLVTSVLPLSEWRKGFVRTMGKKELKVLLVPHPEDLEELD